MHTSGWVADRTLCVHRLIKQEKERERVGDCVCVPSATPAKPDSYLTLTSYPLACFTAASPCV